MKTKLLPCLCLFFVFVSGSAQVPISDSLALVDLYNSTGGPGWSNHKNWLTDEPVSKWHGISVNGGKVTGVVLLYNNLTGKLPSSFMNLTALKTLRFKGNGALSVVLTPSISKLKNVDYLDLYGTNTNGVIPNQIAQLSKLTILDLSYCHLTGALPDSIGYMKQLSKLILPYSGMSGKLPESLGKLASLQWLYLENNSFSGPLPSQGSWPNLTYLSLGSNRFSGTIPRWLGNSKYLVNLSVFSNDFTGKIPDELDSLSALAQVSASYNHLNGPIPEWLLTKGTVTDLYLDHNEFSRSDNPCTVLSPSILEFDLSNNKYTFNGLECIAAHISYNNVAPQAPIKTGTNGKKLTVSAGGTLSNNTYTWYKAGSAQSKVITGDSTFLPPQSGQYYAKVTNKAATTLTLYTDTASYVKTSVASGLNITLSPNPVRGMITVYGLNANKDVIVRITDMTGHVWMQATSRKQAMLQMNTDILKSGHYFLVTSDEDGVKTAGFVKE